LLYLILRSLVLSDVLKGDGKPAVRQTENRALKILVVQFRELLPASQ